MTKLRVLDLFSGIGGFSLGLERTGGFETVAFCEIEEFPRKILRKHWPDTPIFEDVRELKGSDIGPVDVICGGYPCQPFSTAGRRRGKEDDRHLWPEFNRLVAELRPSWVIGENVAGHISMGLDDVLSDLEGQGYTCRTFVIPACAVGAPHRRDRCWIVAHGADINSDGGERGEYSPQGQIRQPARAGDSYVAYSERNNGQGQQRKCTDAQEWPKPRKRQAGSRCNGSGGRRVESRMGRVVDGISAGLDEPRERVTAGVKDRAARLKALGNAVVPQIPEMIGNAILEAL